MLPEDLLAKLKLGASIKTQETLDAIYQICSEQRERGLCNFSIATISRLGFKRGVPKAQSLRNKSAEHYRALIMSFADTVRSVNTNNISKKDKDWIEEIANPKDKLLVKIQASELVAAKKMLRELIPPNSIIEVFDHKNADMGVDSKLVQQERRSLEYLLSKDFQFKYNFTETEYGELVDENNQIVFKAGTLNALKKALLHL